MQYLPGRRRTAFSCISSRAVAILSLLMLAACNAALPDDQEQVTWYATNSGGAMRIIVFDLVCNRRHGNVRISGRGETAITTCANSEGRAQIRYRPDSYANRSDGWANRSNIRANQRVFIQ